MAEVEVEVVAEVLEEDEKEEEESLVTTSQPTIPVRRTRLRE